MEVGWQDTLSTASSLRPDSSSTLLLTALCEPSLAKERPWLGWWNCHSIFVKPRFFWPAKLDAEKQTPAKNVKTNILCTTISSRWICISSILYYTYLIKYLLVLVYLDGDRNASSSLNYWKLKALFDSARTNQGSQQTGSACPNISSRCKKAITIQVGQLGHFLRYTSAMPMYTDENGIDDRRPRCTGHCCLSFSLEYPWQKVKEEYQLYQSNPEKCRIPDVNIIFPMLIPLGKFRNQEVFTCKNLSKEGNCQIYETRPKMCRDFPGPAPCPYRNCSSHGYQSRWRRIVNWLRD